MRRKKKSEAGSGAGDGRAAPVTVRFPGSLTIRPAGGGAGGQYSALRDRLVARRPLAGRARRDRPGDAQHRSGRPPRRPCQIRGIIARGGDTPRLATTAAGRQVVPIRRPAGAPAATATRVAWLPAAFDRLFLCLSWRSWRLGGFVPSSRQPKRISSDGRRERRRLHLRCPAGGGASRPRLRRPRACGPAGRRRWRFRCSRRRRSLWRSRR